MSPLNTLIPRLQGKNPLKKRFYMQGLHKNQGSFPRAVDHLVDSQVVEEDRDCADDVVNEPSCNTIDMSDINFGNKRKVTSPKLQRQKELLNSSEVSSTIARTTEDNSPVTSEMESQLLNDTIKQPTYILYEGHEESKLIDGMRNDNYIKVINRIDMIDEILQDHNNGDTETTWYDAINISSVNLRHRYIMEGISSTDIFHEEEFDPSIETVSVDDDTIKVSNVLINNVDTTRFYDDPRAQMDGGAKCSVTNILEILRNITWFDKKKNPKPVHMKGATSGTLIIPAAKGWLQVQANTKDQYLDVLCYYSPHFTSTLLSDRYVLLSNQCAKEYSGQVMSKYFDLNNKRVNDDLRKWGCINLQDVDGYHLDYGNCTLTCVHVTKKCRNIEIPGII